MVKLDRMKSSIIKFPSTDCPFCAPDRKNSQFHETNSFSALYNIAPVVPGHSLIVPNRHVEAVGDLDPRECIRLIQYARCLTDFLVETFDASGFDWIIQEGADAGQSIPHLHFHIIPRRPNDLKSPGAWYSRLHSSVSLAPGVDVDSELRSRLTPVEMDGILSELGRRIGEHELSLNRPLDS